MTLRANYKIVSKRSGNSVTIRDVGPWDRFMSVTNDAENVVEDLFRLGFLSEGERLFYYDSDDELDEIVIEDGQFKRFAPGPR